MKKKGKQMNTATQVNKSFGVKSKDKETEEAKEQKELIHYIKITYDPQDQETLQICPLWGDRYRLNYWAKENGVGKSIVRSIVVRVWKEQDGIVSLKY